MRTTQIRLYDFFRHELKLSEEKAKEAIEIYEEFKEGGDVATKDFVRAECNDIRTECAKIRTEMSRLETRLTNKMFWSSLVQIITILGGIAAIAKFFLK